MTDGYGLTIFNGGRGAERFRRAVALARQAEQAGFSAVWTSELYNRSATVPMALLASGTQRIRIGCGIAYGVGRSPVTWAAEARDLDELSGGRLILGLGNGTRGMMENWHGVSPDAPAARTEELVEVLRKLWRLHEGPVHHEGRFYRVHLQPTTETAPPYQEHLPIWTAGVNARMVRAAGQVADGLVGHPMFTGEYVRRVVRPALADGAQRAQRDLDGFRVMGTLMCAVDDDEELARHRAAFAIAQYAASRMFDRLFELHGWADNQRRIRDAARDRDAAAMAAAVPDEAVDAIAVACTPSALAQRVVEHARDYDHLNLVVPPWGLAPEQAEEGTRMLIDTLRPVLQPRSTSGAAGLRGASSRRHSDEGDDEHYRDHVRDTPARPTQRRRGRDDAAPPRADERHDHRHVR